jgi:DNA polymerase V
MESIDSINRKWGRDTVKVAAMGVRDKSLMKQEKKSPRYTTSWEEMPVAYI